MLRKKLLCFVLIVWMAPAAEKVPEAWSDKSVAGYRLPLAELGQAPKMISGASYYALPEYNLKTYPVYAPDKEPKDYIDFLRSQDPKPLVEIGKLHTRADWIAAGREVFYGRELPRFSGSEDNFQLIRDPRVIAAYKLQTTRDGVLLGLRYVVREKGKIELGTDTCAMCHTQVQQDGSVIEGPPNVHTPFGPLMASLTRRYAAIGPDFLEERRRKHMREDYRVPFLHADPNLPVADLPAEEIAKLYEQNPIGVHARTNTSLLYPVKIANLIGIENEKFFDRTGTARQRDITDLMKYCGAIADVTDALTEYGPGPEGTMHLANMGLGQGVKRTPDALLYALALYLYSLKPPPNPNPVNAESQHGKQVFSAEQCGKCHGTGRLTPAKGYHASPDLLRETGALDISAGTDPNLALNTRKGTGFYRIPTLRMLWLERAFLHDGSIGTLEEYFNPARLNSDFRSSNWSPLTKPHAVAGHPYGLKLNPGDRAALIAYLKTL